jgi:hypothetical protein
MQESALFYSYSYRSCCYSPITAIHATVSTIHSRMDLCKREVDYKHIQPKRLSFTYVDVWADGHTGTAEPFAARRHVCNTAHNV